jgi:hypothetical protein
VEAMINLLIIIGAILFAFRMIRPLLRIAISMLVKLVGFGFLIAMAIILVIALLSHGMLI